MFFICISADYGWHCAWHGVLNRLANIHPQFYLIIVDHYLFYKRSKDIDVPFRLLIELVVELKKGDGGWLVQDIEVGGDQGVDRLRKTIAGYLLEKDAKKFIENGGSTRYRISTHPNFVTYDRGNLLKHTDTEVRELAKKLTIGC